MCGFYRHFVPNFAAITGPLTHLLRKDVRWKWSGECQEALVKVKTSLCDLVLRAPDFQKPFRLAVDACDVGVGAVLLQAGFERQVAYFKKGGYVFSSYHGDLAELNESHLRDTKKTQHNPLISFCSPPLCISPVSQF